VLGRRDGVWGALSEGGGIILVPAILLPVRWRRRRAGTPVRLPASYTLCSEIVTENLIDNLGEVYRVARCVHPMKL